MVNERNGEYRWVAQARGAADEFLYWSSAYGWTCHLAYGWTCHLSDATLFASADAASGIRGVEPTNVKPNIVRVVYSPAVVELDANAKYMKVHGKHIQYSDLPGAKKPWVMAADNVGPLPDTTAEFLSWMVIPDESQSIIKLSPNGWQIVWRSAHMAMALDAHIRSEYKSGEKK